jgi:hypothetical protein
LGPFVTENDYCDAILQGTVDIEALANLTKLQDLLQSMHYPDPLQPTMMISSTITAEGIANMVKHSCEHTSSSPCGQHNEHYTLLHWLISVSNGENHCDDGKKLPTP